MAAKNVPRGMNCAPNDLACVVRSTCPATCYPHVIGAHITVSDPIETEAGPAWCYFGPRVLCPLCRGEFDFFMDADLQPIRGRPTIAAAERMAIRGRGRKAARENVTDTSAAM